MNDGDWLRKRLRNKDRSTGCVTHLVGLLLVVVGLGSWLALP